MELSGLTVLVGAVAAFVAMSILTVGSLTFLSAVADKASSKRKWVKEVDRMDDGSTLLNVTYPEVYSGTDVSVVKAMIRFLVPTIVWFYALCSAIFIAIPICIVMYDGEVVDKDGKSQLVFNKKQEMLNILQDLVEQAVWGNSILLLFSIYCVLLGGAVLICKNLIDNCKPDEIVVNYTYRTRPLR